MLKINKYLGKQQRWCTEGKNRAHNAMLFKSKFMIQQYKHVQSTIQGIINHTSVLKMNTPLHSTLVEFAKNEGYWRCLNSDKSSRKETLYCEYSTVSCIF